MSLLITAVLTFMIFDDSIKLCLSHPDFITSLEKTGTKMMKDSAPLVAQLPVVGPAAVLGADVGQAIGSNKKRRHRRRRPYRRGHYRTRSGGGTRGGYGYEGNRRYGGNGGYEGNGGYGGYRGNGGYGGYRGNAGYGYGSKG